MTFCLRLVILLSLGSLPLIGCSKERPQVDMPQVQRGSASITGVVRLDGAPPPSKVRLVACSPAPDAPKMSHIDRTVVASAEGLLANVYVYVKNGPRGSGKGETPAVLDQKDCYFEPHALGIQIGQPLRLRNSDPTFHNIHWEAKNNTAINVGFAPAPASPERVVALSGAEFLSVRCDVHDWMKSSIGVFDNPFFAVTDARGEYRITGLPGGTYIVGTYHPFYGHGQDVEITVSDSESAARDFTYAPGQP